MRNWGCFLLLGIALTACAQPAFDVASVKPATHGRKNGLSISSDPEVPSPGSFTVINNSLADLIRWAYRLKEYQVSGPAWLNDDNESFDIEARMPPGTPKAQLRVMMQTLLQERFKLAFHRETKTLPVYELVTAKGGPKLATPKPDAKRGLSYEGKFWSTISSETTTTADLASLLADRLGRPVTDKTGITTRFAIDLQYRNQENDLNHPDLFQALPEKLGLKLQGAKGPVETIVIDHIEKTPSEN